MDASVFSRLIECVRSGRVALVSHPLDREQHLVTRLDQALGETTHCLLLTGSAESAHELAGCILDGLSAPSFRNPCAVFRAYASHLSSLGGRLVLVIGGGALVRQSALRWLVDVCARHARALRLVVLGNELAPSPLASTRLQLPLERIPGEARSETAGAGCPPETTEPGLPSMGAGLTALSAVAAAVIGIALPVWLVTSPAPPPPSPTPAPGAARAPSAPPAPSDADDRSGANRFESASAAIRVDSERRISFQLSGASLEEVLRRIGEQADLEIVNRIGEHLDRPVTAQADALRPEPALAMLLRDFETALVFDAEGGGSVGRLRTVIIVAERGPPDTDEDIAVQVDRLIEGDSARLWEDPARVVESFGSEDLALAALQALDERVPESASQRTRVAMARASLRSALCAASSSGGLAAARTAGVLSCPKLPPAIP